MLDDLVLTRINDAAREGSEVLDLSGLGLPNVPVEIGKLTHLKELVLSNNYLTDLPKELSNLTQLTRLVFSNNQFTQIPQVIWELSTLTRLNFNKNRLTELPSQIAFLKRLQRLSLGGYELSNQLTHLPDEILHLHDLSHLDLGGNRLVRFPQVVCEIKNLNWLEIGGNGLSELPPTIGQLAGLTWLNLSKNRLTHLPPEIGLLTNLQELYLGGFAAGNMLRDLPAGIGNLRRLVKLGLGGNQLTSLPPEIGNLTELFWLDLGGNQLTSLPSEFFNLENLRQLDLSKNSFAELPPLIGRLINLEELNLGGFDAGNRLTSLPAEIGRLVNLNSLRLGGNELTTLPKEFWNLQKLARLDLGGNKLGQISSNIERLSNLRELILAANKLSSLPLGMKHLTELTELHLDNNQFSTLPEAACKVVGLARLNLADNKIKEIPTDISLLSNLTRLELSNNKLIVLPSEMGALSNLTWLDLSNNQLTELPYEMASLDKLTQLDLHGNKLAYLPENFDELAELVFLDLEDNMLRVPPEILARKSQPHEVIQACFRRQRDVSTHNLNEAKLLIVGEPAVGKTSLVKRLIDNKFDPEEDMTGGVNIRKWQIEGEGPPIVLNIWDFGGQEIMHATHQFFLSKRSLYLLVVATREGEQQSRLEYWLKLIESFGGDAPVIIVVNKIDVHHLELDRRGLRAKYPNICGFVSTSCKEDVGIGELHRLIQVEARRLEHLTTGWSTAEFSVKTELENIRKDYLPYTEYGDICRKYGLVDKADQQALLKLLHDLGVVLSFQDDPRLEDTNILNPRWVTEGVYQIVSSSEIAKQKGIFNLDIISGILDQSRYPRREQNFIIDMMRKFELCYVLQRGDSKEYLVPDLLPKEQPDIDWDREQGLALEFHYNILPTSILSRFLVRMHRFVVLEKTWRSGAVLDDQENHALVQADFEGKKIQVWVSGNEATRRSFLTVIRFHFADIHSSIEKIEVKEFVPIPGTDATIEYKHLIKIERQGFQEYYWPEADTFIPVTALLEGVGTEPQPLFQLHQRILDYFDEAELKNLVFALNIDYDDLPGDRKSDKLRELVLLLNRRDRIHDLLEFCSNWRPKVSWSFEHLT
jgi:internalin A